jgi:competence ComEA-like helix-hairpin-helix protein
LSKNNFIEKVQTFFSVTKTELNIVVIIIVGLVIGLIGKYTFFNKYPQDKINVQKLQFMLDSISKAEKSTFIGTDIELNIDSTLALGDTIVKPNELGSFKRKKLPLSKIDINQASKIELMKLPGIGEKMADVILNYRKTHKFNITTDFMKVKGIGKKKYSKIEKYIKVE